MTVVLPTAWPVPENLIILLFEVLEHSAGHNDTTARGIAVAFIISECELIRSESTKRCIDLVDVGKLADIDVCATQNVTTQSSLLLSRYDLSRKGTRNGLRKRLKTGWAVRWDLLSNSTWLVSRSAYRAAPFIIQPK
jgi:hypothetical protein